ncbi:hypothetical protein [Peribacillus sp. SI8-4]|uniref:hypothetical protein n=1 Tax=Peribacillus sp. SI8-4 TaxID=3048009 RepID=UPI00255641F6|nr:hypothetical protein [Peribacillus sp. SI8-4]
MCEGGRLLLLCSFQEEYAAFSLPGKLLSKADRQLCGEGYRNSLEPFCPYECGVYHLN